MRNKVQTLTCLQTIFTWKLQTQRKVSSLFTRNISRSLGRLWKNFSRDINFVRFEKLLKELLKQKNLKPEVFRKFQIKVKETSQSFYKNAENLKEPEK